MAFITHQMVDLLFDLRITNYKIVILRQHVYRY